MDFDTISKSLEHTNSSKALNSTLFLSAPILAMLRHVSTSLLVTLLGLIVVRHGVVNGFDMIDIEIGVSTPKSFVVPPCSPNKEAKFQANVERFVDKKFQRFYDDLAAVYGDEVADQVCYYDNRRRELVEVVDKNEHRGLRSFRQKKFGFVYQSTFKCSYCNPDDFDHAVAQPDPVDAGGGIVVVEKEKDITITARLKARLQRQLTRKLTQKVNQNKKSCLRESDSVVTVRITERSSFVKDEGASLVCP